jgi:hypothetical protein
MNDELRERAARAIDEAHRGDPSPAQGRAGELDYADRVSRWIARLVAAPSDALVLAARAQHLERWVIRRDAYPMDRTGYFKWRKAVQERQRRRVIEILRDAGCDDALGARVGALVAKASPRGDAEGQALEDAACLVFIESELAPFADEHPDYTREKFVDILQKTWVKMSPHAQALGREIPQPPPLADLIAEATRGS